MNLSFLVLATGETLSCWPGPMVDMPLAVLLMLLEKVLCLLSGLESEPSRLATLRMVADLVSDCFVVTLPRPLMLLVTPVGAGVRVRPEESSGCWTSGGEAFEPAFGLEGQLLS